MLIRTGTWQPLSGTTAAREPALNGTVVADELVRVQFTRGGRPVIELDCQDRVVRSTLDGRLHFYFRVRRVVSNDSGQPVRLHRVSRFPGEVPDSSSVDVDLDWRQDGLGSLAPAEGGYLLPDASWRFAAGRGELPADGSRFMYARTRARTHNRTARIQVVLEIDEGVLDSTETSVSGFGPA